MWILLFLMASSTWCSACEDVFTIPHAWENQKHKGPKYFKVAEPLPASVKKIEGFYGYRKGGDWISMCKQDKILSVHVYTGGLGFPGYPLLVSWTENLSPIVFASVGVCPLSTSLHGLTLVGPTPQSSKKFELIDLDVLALAPTKGGETKFSLAKEAMTVTRVTNAYDRRDRSFYIQAVVSYACLSEVVVRWGVCTKKGAEAKIGEHTFSLPGANKTSC